MCFIKYVLRIPLRMSEDDLLAGDDAIHGEAAYVFGGELGMGGAIAGPVETGAVATRSSTIDSIA